MDNVFEDKIISCIYFVFIDIFRSYLLNYIINSIYTIRKLEFKIKHLLLIAYIQLGNLDLKLSTYCNWSKKKSSDTKKIIKNYNP